MQQNAEKSVEKNIGKSADESLAFHQSVAGARPLSFAERVFFEAEKPKPRPLQFLLDEESALNESLEGFFSVDELLQLNESESYVANGVSKRSLRDLRRGRWAISAHTDLHGLNRYEAQDALREFLSFCQKEGKRCIRIVHGRGHHSPDNEGVLRHLVRSWLSKRRDVLAFCPAPFNDGGAGAVWVLLKQM